MKLAVAIFLVAMTSLSAHAEPGPSEQCSSKVIDVALKFAKNHALNECHPLDPPDFDHSRGPGAGLVSVDLDCDRAQAQVNMLWAEDGATCGLSHVRFWNP